MIFWIFCLFYQLFSWLEPIFITFSTTLMRIQVFLIYWKKNSSKDSAIHSSFTKSPIFFSDLVFGFNFHPLRKRRNLIFSTLEKSGHFSSFFNAFRRLIIILKWKLSRLFFEYKTIDGVWNSIGSINFFLSCRKNRRNFLYTKSISLHKYFEAHYYDMTKFLANIRIEKEFTKMAMISKTFRRLPYEGIFHLGRLFDAIKERENRNENEFSMYLIT